MTSDGCGLGLYGMRDFFANEPIGMLLDLSNLLIGFGFNIYFIKIDSFC